ncbi:MAG: hypothetical protein ACKOTE_14345, partial [Opitutaceae bacterium]
PHTPANLITSSPRWSCSYLVRFPGTFFRNEANRQCSRVISVFDSLQKFVVSSMAVEANEAN